LPALSSRSASDIAVDRKLCFGIEDVGVRGANDGDVAVDGSCPGDGATTRVVFAAIVIQFSVTKQGDVSGTF
jgi:hypothetical protein